jgi:hypothetical protein
MTTKQLIIGVAGGILLAIALLVAGQFLFSLPGKVIGYRKFKERIQREAPGWSAWNKVKSMTPAELRTACGKPVKEVTISSLPGWLRLDYPHYAFEFQGNVMFLTYATGTKPQDWRELNVVPVPDPRLGGLETPAADIIAAMPCLDKLSEKLPKD